MPAWREPASPGTTDSLVSPEPSSAVLFASGQPGSDARTGNQTSECCMRGAWSALMQATKQPPTVSFRGARRRAPLRSARRSRQGGTDSTRARVVSARDSVLRGLHRLSPGLQSTGAAALGQNIPSPSRSVLGSWPRPGLQPRSRSLYIYIYM